MADVELTKALRDLPIRIQTASRRERYEVLHNVEAVLSNPGISESIVRGLCKVLQLTLPRYRDSTSQSYVKRVIISLVKQHGDWTIKHLTANLTDIAVSHCHLIPTKNTSQSGLYALSWSCLLIEHGLNNCSDNAKAEFQRLVDAQAVLLSVVAAAGVGRNTAKAYKILSTMWKSVKGSEELYSNALTSAEPSAHIVVFGSYLIRYLSETKRTELIAKYKPSLLDIFIKVAISCKNKPALYIVKESEPLLKHVTHEEFKQFLLPAMQKAMLRNPEIILECVGNVMLGLSLDLSQYAQGIGKSLVANLHSKEDLARDESVAACRSLALQCSDSGALEGLLHHLFDVFHGSEGKLTVATHKISVLDGAGNLSYNAVTGSSVQKLASSAADHFIKVLDTEVHEKTLIHALEVFSLWCTKFSNEVPNKVLDWLKKGPGLKTSTAGVRTAYIGCMSACFNGNTLGQGVDFIPYLLKTVEKAVGQATQVPIVTEALSAACLLLKIVSSDVGADKNLGNFWTIVLDMDKQLFVSEKFLTLASDNALYHVLLLCERLLLDHIDKLNGRTQPLHKAIVYCLTAPSSSLRLRCQPVVRKLVSTLGGTQLARSLLKELTRFLETARVHSIDSDKESDSGGEMSAKVLVSCITVLCSGANLVAEDRQMLALDSLICSHHPAIVAIAPDLWLKLLKYLKLEPEVFIKQFEENIKKMLIDEYTPTQCLENCLETVVDLNPEVILPPLVIHVGEILGDTAILHVTKTEYFTFLMPEGELYDKSVVSGKDHENELDARNMKRESKVYSYKEQLEEIQLRRELEDKKRKQGKLKEPELTVKQKEAMRLQLEKESAIRSKLTQLNQKLTCVVSMTRAVARGNGAELSMYFRDLLPFILRDLQSPLAASCLIQLYVELRHCVFTGEQSSLGELVAHVSLRLRAPQCDLDPRWEEEDVNVAVARTIKTLHRATVRSRRPHHEPTVHLTAPAFCYVFPLLRSALLTRSDDDLVTLSLQIIAEHAQMRGESLKDLHHPMLLPRRQMFELLIDLISKYIV
uniref:Stalled ribosome sensor GCN1-like N-terminal domain-containing protein n=1 Tax=Timema monikensis TaxID=170555 RepID=A0A7R9EG30_9NEOP|nr:unnamed protein product [Timema monikensis]